MHGILESGIIGVELGAQYALVALGFTLIFGILGVINFAHGGFYVIGGYLTYLMASAVGLAFPLAVVVATLIAAAVGYLFELLLLDRYLSDEFATLILTLGLYLVMFTAVLVTFGPEPPQFSFPVTSTIRGAGLYIPVANLIVLGVCGLAIALVYLLMYRTEFGRALRALADDRTVAMAQGIPTRWLYPLAFGLATGLAALTGALVMPTLTLSPSAGVSVLVTSFTVVILGGLGSVGGATVAAFAVGIVDSYSTTYLGGSKGALALFILVLVTLVVRPSGLFGRLSRHG
jgi:branched-chain amino acid transport system permease protein